MTLSFFNSFKTNLKELIGLIYTEPVLPSTDTPLLVFLIFVFKLPKFNFLNFFVPTKNLIFAPKSLAKSPKYLMPFFSVYTRQFQYMASCD